jgi:NADH-quinone oxidoreductase subunit E
VCDSISCELTGGQALMDGLCAELGIQPGETTADGEITILPIVCLGHCDRAPCLLAGETVHGPLESDPASVKSLVTQLRK